MKGIAHPDQPQTAPGRLHEIDGIRGWAALSVLLYHLYIELFLKVWPAIGGFVPRVFIHGPLAVSIFFVLSGDALTSAFLAGGHRSLDSMVIKRYFRLTIPIFMSSAVVWCLLKMGLVYNAQAGAILNHQDWIGSWLQFEPSLASLMHYAAYQVYANNEGSHSYNPFLWTMSLEIIGSMLVFLYLHVHAQLKNPKRVLWCIIVFTFLLRSFYSLFFVGIVFSLLRHEGFFKRQQIKRLWIWAAPLLVLLCALIDAWNLCGPNLGAHVDLVLGSVVVFSLYSTAYFQHFFSSKWSLFLGNISFPLYLIHFSILVSLSSWLVVAYSASGPLDARAMLTIATLSSLGSMAAATLFWRVEHRALQHVGRLPQWLLLARRP